MKNNFKCPTHGAGVTVHEKDERFTCAVVTDREYWCPTHGTIHEADTEPSGPYYRIHKNCGEYLKPGKIYYCGQPAERVEE